MDKYYKIFIRRKNKIINILELFREDKYPLLLLGYLIYIPDDLIDMMYKKLCDYRGHPDNEMFELIIKYMDELKKEN